MSSVGTPPPANLDFSDLSRETKRLMVVYSRAIGASNSIPALSTSVFTLYFSIFLWSLGLYLTVIVGLFDLVLIAARSIFGRPKILIGRRLYAYVLRPFRRAWEGEVPALRTFVLA